MNTLKQFAAESHISESLIRAVVRQCGGWEAFTEMARDVTEGGASGGFHGFIYHADTVPFAKRNKALILESCKQMADDLGESLYSMIAGFNCLKISEGEAAEGIHNARSDDHTQVMNALAWYALEEVARSYSDQREYA